MAAHGAARTLHNGDWGVHQPDILFIGLFYFDSESVSTEQYKVPKVNTALKSSPKMSLILFMLKRVKGVDGGCKLLMVHRHWPLSSWPKEPDWAVIAQ